MGKKALWLDGVVGSQLRDTQGEMLNVEGADIADLEVGKGRWNDNHGKGFFNSLGVVTEAKKIFKAEDCENERHKYYWEKVKAPYIYAKGYLYDDEDHMNAKAAAAILRNIHKTDCPLKIKASVEGGVVARGIKDPSLLAQTKIHSIALTFTPANQATLLEPLNLDKSVDEAADEILIKSVMHLAEKDVPSFRHITKAASAVKVARNIKQMQNLIKKMKDEQDMEKGMKEMAAGAAMLGSLAGAGAPAVAKQPVAAPKAPAIQQVKKPVTHQALIQSIKSKNPNLWAISQIESSGGKNLNHDTLEGGQHKGMTAGGPWGMMPKTAAYVLKVSPKLRKKYADLAEKAGDLDTNHQAFTDALNKDPNAAYEFANTLYNHLKRIEGGNEDRILHSWHYGIQGTKKAAEKLGEDNIKNDEYVNKVRSVRNPAGIKKALTAGYGGAGAPTSRTGGSVFQTEALEGGGRGFKRVACEHCGDEQIYAKHQVKCRNCGKSWSLATLYKVMVGSK